MTALGRYGQGDDGWHGFYLASPEAAFHGASLKIDGGFTA